MGCSHRTLPPAQWRVIRTRHQSPSVPALAYESLSSHWGAAGSGPRLYHSYGHHRLAIGISSGLPACVPPPLLIWQQSPSPPPLWNRVTARTFSIRRKRKNKPKPSKGKNKDKGPPVNEALVTALLDKRRGETALSIQVRLVIDRGVGEPSDISVVSLHEAMETSREMEVDLVGVNLDQEFPVIKAADFQKMQYEAKKKTAGKPSGGGAKQLKEFKFKAGIDDSDLQRKADNMMNYLEKGHPCQVVITARRLYMNMDQDAVVNTLTRVRDILGDRILESREMRTNENKNFANITFQPNPSYYNKKK